MLTGVRRSRTSHGTEIGCARYLTKPSVPESSGSDRNRCCGGRRAGPARRASGRFAPTVRRVRTNLRTRRLSAATAGNRLRTGVQPGSRAARPGADSHRDSFGGERRCRQEFYDRAMNILRCSGWGGRSNRTLATAVHRDGARRRLHLQRSGECVLKHRRLADRVSARSTSRFAGDERARPRDMQLLRKPLQRKILRMFGGKGGFQLKCHASLPKYPRFVR